MNYIVTKQTKSRGIAAILVCVFWPVGMFYSTIIGAVIMCFVVGPIVLYFSVSSDGLALILLPIYFTICLVWAIRAVNSYNKKINSKDIFYQSPKASEQVENLNTDLDNEKIIDEKILEYPISKRSYTVIWILTILLIISLLFLMYDSKTNSIRLNKISEILFSHSKDKEEIKNRIEKTYSSFMNGEFCGDSYSKLDSNDLPFYNTNSKSYLIKAMAPITKDALANIKTEPININVYEFTDDNNAKARYDLVVKWAQSIDTAHREMSVKKVGGNWELNVEQFFGGKSNQMKIDKKEKVAENIEDKISNKYLQDKNHDVWKVTYQRYEDDQSDIKLNTEIYFVFYENKIYKIQTGDVKKIWHIKKQEMSDEVQIISTNEKDEVDVFGDITIRPKHGRAIVYLCDQIPVTEMAIDRKYINSTLSN